jgi:catechol 2,3-dioxygenase-like lactoylglutathione lyase family enzyme
MKRTRTIIGVSDVLKKFQWYQALLGIPPTKPAHDFFGQILDTDETVLLCLHKSGMHGHPSLTSSSHAEPGNGLLLFFRVDDFEKALVRARALTSSPDLESQINASTGTKEFALRDPDGYYVTISNLNPA